MIKTLFALLKGIQRDPFFVIPIMAVLMALALTLELKKADTTKLTDDPKLVIMTITLFATIILAALAGLLRYLRSDEGGTNARSAGRVVELEHLLHKVRNITEKNLGIDKEERDALRTALLAEITRDSGRQLLQQLEEKLKAQMPEALLITALEEREQQTVGRLLKEVQALGRRSNLNLVIGILTAVTGLAVLACVIFLGSDHPVILNTNDLAYRETLTDLLRGFLPRLSLVLLIEVFAYFFLKLYKANLGEIKYFQNELTNLEAKFSAARLSAGDGR